MLISYPSIVLWPACSVHVNQVDSYSTNSSTKLKCKYYDLINYGKFENAQHQITFKHLHDFFFDFVVVFYVKTHCDD